MNNVNNQALVNKQYQVISLSPGVIEGGYEQIILDILPGIVEMDEVKYWSFERVGDHSAFARILLDISEDKLPDALEYCEGGLADKVKDDARLVMLPLVEVSSQSEVTDEDAFWGVYHSSIKIDNDNEAPEERKALELLMCKLAQAIIGKVRTDSWDRKTIAPALFYTILSCMVKEADVSTVSYQIMEVVLEEDSNKSIVNRSIRENVHRLKKGGVDFLSLCKELVSTDNEIFTKLRELGHAGRDIAYDNDVMDIKLCAEIWKRFSNKIGFSNLEAAYIACMVSVDCKGMK